MMRDKSEFDLITSMKNPVFHCKGIATVKITLRKMRGGGIVSECGFGEMSYTRWNLKKFNGRVLAGSIAEKAEFHSVISELLSG
jgi:hypothetical protein